MCPAIGLDIIPREGKPSNGPTGTIQAPSLGFYEALNETGRERRKLSDAGSEIGRMY
jgi:hypothetical protein